MTTMGLTVPAFAKKRPARAPVPIQTPPRALDGAPSIRSPNIPPVPRAPSRTPNRNPVFKRTPATPIMVDPLPYQPRTPLITPKVGLAKYNLRTYTPRPGVDRLQMPDVQSHPGGSEILLDPDYLRIPDFEQLLEEGENPWIPFRTDGSTDIKVAAMTPIGTTALVPTADKRPPTPRRFTAQPPTPGKHLTLKVIDPSTGKEIQNPPDPLLHATIYLDCTKPQDRDYNYVPERMRALSRNIYELQQQYKNVLQPIPQLTGRVSKAQFETALSVYENNQVYYQDCIDDRTMDDPTIRIRLTELEHWFMLIIEPRTNDDLEGWRERERFKLTQGVSGYCDPELYSYIGPLSPMHQTSIRQHHARLKI